MNIFSKQPYCGHSRREVVDQCSCLPCLYQMSVSTTSDFGKGGDEKPCITLYYGSVECKLREFPSHLICMMYNVIGIQSKAAAPWYI